MQIPAAAAPAASSSSASSTSDSPTNPPKMLCGPQNCQRQTRRRYIEISNSVLSSGRVQTTNIKPRTQHIRICSQRGGIPTNGHHSRTHARTQTKRLRPSAAPTRPDRPTAETENKNISNELCICGAFDGTDTQKDGRVIAAAAAVAQPPDAPAAERSGCVPAGLIGRQRQPFRRFGCRVLAGVFFWSLCFVIASNL